MQLNYNDLIKQIDEKKQHFKKFTKQYKNQLEYMEYIIRIDAQTMAETQTCCFCFIKTKNNFKMLKEQTEKLNEPFYNVIEKMKYFQRQLLFSELLSMMGVMLEIYEAKKMEVDKVNMDINALKVFRQDLHMELQDRFLSVDAQKQIPLVEQATIYLKTQIDGFSNERVVRAEHNTLLFIYKIKKTEIQTRVDLRNYLLMEHISEKTFPFILQAMFKCVSPKIIKMTFLDHKERDLLIPHIREVVRAGRIERLVNNFDLENMIFNGRLPQMPKSKRQSLFAEALIQSRDSDSDEEEQNMDITVRFQTSISSKYKRLSLFKKQSQLNIYNETKRKLIQALNELAQKKNEHNRKVKHFLNRQLYINKKKQSQELINAINNTQANINPKDRTTSIQDSCQEYQIDDNQNCMSIVVRKKQRDNPHVLNHRASNEQQESESFRHTNIDDVDSIELNQEGSQDIDTVYASMYPQRKLSLFSINRQYKEVNLTEKIWSVPIPKATNLQIQNQFDIKTNKQRVRIYQHKDIKNKYKIIFILKLKLLSAIGVLANVAVWQKWHPNIEDIDIIEANDEENSVRVLIKGKTEQNQFQLPLKIHLFKIESKYLVVMKSQKNKNEKPKTRTQSFFDFFGFSSASLTRNYNYLLFTLQNTGVKDSNCQISIEVELNPSQLSKISNLLKEQLSFFINFSYLTNYFKLKQIKQIDSEEQNRNNKGVLRIDYVVRKSEILLKKYH